MPRPATRAEVVASVAALPDDRPCFVGIDGLGGAGKTSLAAVVHRRVPGTVVVHVDDLQGEGITEWDWHRLARDVVQPLLAGRTATYALTRWGEAQPYGYASVEPTATVVIEGVSATRAEADVPWDLTVWVDADDTVRRRRTADRDGPDLQQLWQQWIGTEVAYVERERPQERVDLLVDGTEADPAQNLGE